MCDDQEEEQEQERRKERLTILDLSHVVFSPLRRDIGTYGIDLAINKQRDVLCFVMGPIQVLLPLSLMASKY